MSRNIAMSAPAAAAFDRASAWRWCDGSRRSPTEPFAAGFRAVGATMGQVCRTWIDRALWAESRILPQPVANSLTGWRRFAAACRSPTMEQEPDHVIS